MLFDSNKIFLLLFSPETQAGAGFSTFFSTLIAQ
jgi:hypothetical protein